MKRKIFLVIVIFCTIFINLNSVALARVDITQITDGATIDGTDTIKNFGKNIYSILSTIGVALSVIVLAIIGTKYMLGSAEEKASYKKSLMPYVIGCVLLFGASTIATIVYNFGRGI